MTVAPVRKGLIMPSPANDKSQLGFATFDEAWACARRLARNHEYDYCAVRLHDSAWPYSVLEDGRGHNVLACVTADPERGLCYTPPRRMVVPLAPVLNSANDR